MAEHFPPSLVWKVPTNVWPASSNPPETASLTRPLASLGASLTLVRRKTERAPRRAQTPRDAQVRESTCVCVCVARLAPPRFLKYLLDGDAAQGHCRDAVPQWRSSASSAFHLEMSEIYGCRRRSCRPLESRRQGCSPRASATRSTIRWRRCWAISSWRGATWRAPASTRRCPTRTTRRCGSARSRATSGCSHATWRSQAGSHNQLPPAERVV